MRLRILRQTSISGLPARVGDVVDVSDHDARLLLGSGKADPAPAMAEDPAPATPRKPRTRKSNGRS